MSGNLCRCGADTIIADAIEDVLKQSAPLLEATERTVSIMSAPHCRRCDPCTQCSKLASIGGWHQSRRSHEIHVATPSCLVDINRLPLKAIELLPEGGFRIGALATNSDIAWHDGIRSNLPMLSIAILAGASPQLRNAATTGGNLLQRTRCYYFYDPSAGCNKREPGSGCSAIGGVNRIHAILGTSDSCIAVHPSDMCVALTALDATIDVEGPDGKRSIPIAAFHRLPEKDPHLNNTMLPGELITSIVVPVSAFGDNHTYLKIRDRLSYAFALVSVAAALRIRDGVVEDVRAVLGGMAHKPWRNLVAEDRLKGQPAETASFSRFADEILREAKGQQKRISSSRRAIFRALEQAAVSTPQDQSNKSLN